MTTQINELKTHVSAILPLLDANLGAANKEWMAGDISRGAYEYCLQRHAVALSIIGMDVSELNEDGAFKAGATLFIDLRSAIKDVPVEKRDSEQKKVDDFLSFYVDSGFTEEHALFKIPIRPTVN
jgi:hypothetical protein